MPKSQTPKPEEGAEFNLKHRVIGAAVLLFFGAAVLPWLLGPPSEASKFAVQGSNVSGIQLKSEVKAIDLLGDGIASDNIEETIFISKITPFDANKKSNSSEAAIKAVNRSANKGSDAEVSSVEEKAKPAAKEQAELKRQGKIKADELRVKQRKEREAAALKSKLAKKQSKNKSVTQSKVDVGWIVQVGLFTEKRRATAFISDLKSKGFDAYSNVVNTNRGKNTGTRVWLGPFARKVSANNELKRLKAKAKKDGFIRVYP